MVDRSFGRSRNMISSRVVATSGKLRALAGRKSCVVKNLLETSIAVPPAKCLVD